MDGETYMLDIAAGLTQVLGDGTTQYLYGLTRIGEDSTDWRYYHGDGAHLRCEGSVRALSDSAGELISSHAYSPYGDPTTESPDTFGYTGEQTDPTGLLYLRARYYNPSMGVFTSHDPWRDDVIRPASMNGWLKLAKACGLRHHAVP